jgi:anti-sigma factor RsiW
MKECVDEGILQSYFDGELSNEHMEGVTTHLVSCLKCATAARELESEILMLSNALAPEFEAAVPTEHLRHRIDVAVAGLQLGNANIAKKPVATAARSWLRSLGALFEFTPQRTFGYAALVVVVAFAAIIGAIQLRQPTAPSLDKANNVAQETTPSTSTPNVDTGASAVAGITEPEVVNPPAPVNSSVRNRPKKQRPSVSNLEVAEVKLLPGERSYLKTIAALDSTIKANSTKPMRPALRAEYERNLAVVNRALAATRNAAKKNPNDPDAAEFMFNAYQSKVDLLNTVADARLNSRP